MNEDDSTLIEKIDKKDIKPLNDPDCEHDFQPDHDEIGEYKAFSCTKCPLGVFRKV